MYTRKLFNLTGLMDILVRQLEDVKKDIVQRMKDNGQYVTGKTAKAIEVGAMPTPTGVVVWISAPLHIATLETGRKGGKVPKGFTDIIYKWSIKKRISFETKSARRSFAYFTARKIAQEGSWLHRQGFRVDLYTGIVEAFEKRLRETTNFGDLYDITQVTNLLKR